LRKDTWDDRLVGADAADRIRPDLRALPATPVTRFAPAPTGELHLGHLVNAIYVWGLARAGGGRVMLRIEDHDRQRSRAMYERAILDDLQAMGLIPDVPAIDVFRGGATSYRQSDSSAAYAEAADVLRGAGLVYACDCARSTFAAWEADNGRSWSGGGCPGDCRRRALVDDGSIGLRVTVGDGDERWDDLLMGPSAGEPAADGDVLIRDRAGNWTYAFCVVVDDRRQAIDLVIRGRDLLASTPAQIRLASLLGRSDPPRFLHHPLVLLPSGRKLSKADHSTSLRSMLDAGVTPAELLGRAVSLARLRAADAQIAVSELGSLFDPRW
jgi:glutamyl-tRNA synthetase/glutamyl-Q tRNA(Asp) synthetase